MNSVLLAAQTQRLGIVTRAYFNSIGIKHASFPNVSTLRTRKSPKDLTWSTVSIRKDAWPIE